VGATTYADNDGAGSLNPVSSDSLDTTDWEQWPDTLAGLTQAHNGMLIGFVGKELLVSEPYIPYAYSLDNKIQVDSNITGIGASHEFILIVSGKHPYIVYGAAPESLTLKQIPIRSSCESHRSIVSCDRGIFYQAPDGLAHCDGANVTVVTKSWITPEQWTTLMQSASMIGVWWNDKYYGFLEGTNDGVCIDIDKQELTTFTFASPIVNIRDVFHDGSDDTIHILSYNGTADSHRYTFMTNATLKTNTWKSKQFVDPEKYSCVKIRADWTDKGKLEWTYWRNGTETQKFAIFVQDAQPTADQTGDWWFDSNDSYKAYRWSGTAWILFTTVKMGQMFRLPADPGASYKEFQVAGTISIDSIQLATSPEELI